MDLFKLVAAIVVAAESLIIVFIFWPYIDRIIGRQIVRTPTQDLLYYPTTLAPYFAFIILFVLVVWLTASICPKLDVLGWARSRFKKEPQQEDWGWMDV